MLFGSSGIRKLFAQELLSLGPLVGAAVASDAKRVVLATDSRTSRNTLSDAILSGLISGGAEVFFGGIATTRKTTMDTNSSAKTVHPTPLHSRKRLKDGLKIQSMSHGTNRVSYHLLIS